MDTIVNKHKENFLAAKKERRIKKRTEKRDITGEEVIFIFEKELSPENYQKYLTLRERVYESISFKNHR